MMLCKSGKVNDVKKYHLKGWIAQEKKDGVRVMAICDEQVRLIGRSGSDYTNKFPEVAVEMKGLNCVLDGEICCDTFEHTSSRVHTENKVLLSPNPNVQTAEELLEELNQEDQKWNQ